MILQTLKFRVSPFMAFQEKCAMMILQTFFKKLSQSRGGGIGVFYRKKKNVRVHELPQKNIEGMALELCNQNIILIVIYRPGIINTAGFLEIIQNVVNVFQEQGYQCV